MSSSTFMRGITLYCKWVDSLGVFNAVWINFSAGCCSGLVSHWCVAVSLIIRQYLPAWLMHSGFKLLGLSSSLHGGNSVSLHDWMALTLHDWAESAWILCSALIRCSTLAGSSILLGWKSCSSLAVLSVLVWLASRHCWLWGMSEVCLVARHDWLVLSFWVAVLLAGL